MMRTTSIVATVISHQGRVRETHEDAIGVGRRLLPPCEARGELAPVVFRDATEQPWGCVVADGLGGHRAGEVASRLVVQRFVQEVGDLRDEASVREFLLTANEELFRLMTADNSLVGMGTTIAGIIVADGAVTFFNVGDSKAYREQDGFLRQLSVDDVADAGAGDRVLTQALGGTESRVSITPHIGSETIVPDRRYLLCTDGLTDMLDLDSMEACLTTEDHDAVVQLFAGAMAAGGTDNISIALVRIAPTS